MTMGEPEQADTRRSPRALGRYSAILAFICTVCLVVIAVGFCVVVPLVIQTHSQTNSNHQTIVVIQDKISRLKINYDKLRIDVLALQHHILVLLREILKEIGEG